MQRFFLSLAAVYGFFGVVLGAFGGHALKNRLSSDMLSVFEVGVRYQFYHTLALLLVVLISFKLSSKLVMISAGCFSGGVLLFSGSLYLLVATGITKFGMITPVGGMMFILGWIFLILGSFKLKANG